MSELQYCTRGNICKELIFPNFVSKEIKDTKIYSGKPAALKNAAQQPQLCNANFYSHELGMYTKHANFYSCEYFFFYSTWCFMNLPHTEPSECSLSAGHTKNIPLADFRSQDSATCVQDLHYSAWSLSMLSIGRHICTQDLCGLYGSTF